MNSMTQDMRYWQSSMEYASQILTLKLLDFDHAEVLVQEDSEHRCVAG